MSCTLGPRDALAAQTGTLSDGFAPKREKNHVSHEEDMGKGPSASFGAPSGPNSHCDNNKCVSEDSDRKDEKLYGRRRRGEKGSALVTSREISPGLVLNQATRGDEGIQLNHRTSHLMSAALKNKQFTHVPAT